MAGTTAICVLDGSKLAFRTSIKNKDADLFISDFVNQYKAPLSIFIDAPLSLPAVYTGKGDDYFYRHADRELKAMSPMFLGGLTARAMKLKGELEKSGHQVFEAYPAAVAKRLNLKSLNYKKKEGELLVVANAISTHLHLEFKNKPTSWHQVDALLAFWIGTQYKSGSVKIAGDPEEGLIYY